MLTSTRKVMLIVRSASCNLNVSIMDLTLLQNSVNYLVALVKDNSLGGLLKRVNMITLKSGVYPAASIDSTRGK